ncbi:MAG: phosphoglycolate phosphatase [Burkholderiaceae bacterium]
MSLTSSAALLFDLDGTLVDSAPDLAGAGNEMRVARGLAALPLAHFRPMVGSGARGMLGRALDIGPDAANFITLRDEFLDRYERRMTQETRIFDGIPAVLGHLDAARIPWGIVTNKATRFAQPLVAGLRGLAGAATLVCGDTTANAKPHPQPLLEAARRLGVAPDRCVYVGDDSRDVQAGKAAGMMTIVAAWGYLGAGEPIEAWQADAIAQSPTELLILLSTP